MLYSSSFDKIYIGFTNHLRRRFLFHNQLEKSGWTGRVVYRVYSFPADKIY
ncbi:MAG TPA: hypothetical protein VGH64_15930 [Puia sp.]